MDGSSMGVGDGLQGGGNALRPVSPPCPMESISSTPMKKGRASGASQSSVTSPAARAGSARSSVRPSGRVHWRLPLVVPAAAGDNPLGEQVRAQRHEPRAR